MKVQCALLILLVGFASYGQGYKQELWLYLEGTSNALYFDSSASDLSIYGAALSAVNRYCSIGFWNTYEGADYTISRRGLGSVQTSDLYCKDVDSGFIEVGSLRHFGTSNVSESSISLYSDSDFKGQELLVTGRALAGIEIPIKTLAATGTSNWALFEGKNLEGKSICFKVPEVGFNFNWAYDIEGYGLKTVGSVFKGCDVNEIQYYKKALKLTSA